MAEARSGQPKTLQQIHDALGVRLFTPPPEGFNPLKASARELLVHGYPPPPDALRHPELHEHWKQMMSRPMSVIEPEFAVMRDRRSGSRAPSVIPAAPAPPADPALPAWAGSVAFAGNQGTFTWVSGQWTVPDVTVPNRNSGSYSCATWVGIDGPPSTVDLPTDILQAGTQQDIGSTYAWCQWYPDNAMKIPNLPVSHGDIMFCVICVDSPSGARGYMTNVTRGIFTSFALTAMSGQQLQGNTAEWILEAPSQPNGSVDKLAQYGDVYFDECIAGTSGDTLVFAGEGQLWTMHDVNGQAISIPRAENDRLIRVQYTQASA